MCYKHHISLPAVLITPIIILLLSGSDKFLTDIFDLIDESKASFVGNCEKQ